MTLGLATSDPWLARARTAGLMAAITAVLAALYVALRVQPVVTLLVPLAGATLPLVARTHAGVRLAFRWGVALVGLFVAAGAMTVGALFVPTLIALVVGLRATGDRTTPGARDHVI